MAAKSSPLAKVMRLGQAASAEELAQFIEVLKEIQRARFGATRKTRKTTVAKHTPKGPDAAASQA